MKIKRRFGRFLVGTAAVFALGIRPAGQGNAPDRGMSTWTIGPLPPHNGFVHIGL